MHTGSSASAFPLTTALDIWSIGCLAYEFLAGTPLFLVLGGAPNSDDCNDDHLLQMHTALGPLPIHILSQWLTMHRYFNDDGVLYNTMMQGPKAIYQVQTLEDAFKENRPEDMGDVEAESVLDLIRSALTYQLEKRPSAEQMLQHAWLRE